MEWEFAYNNIISSEIATKRDRDVSLAGLVSELLNHAVKKTYSWRSTAARCGDHDDPNCGLYLFISSARLGGCDWSQQP